MVNKADATPPEVKATTEEGAVEKKSETAVALEQRLDSDQDHEEAARASMNVFQPVFVGMSNLHSNTDNVSTRQQQTGSSIAGNQSLTSVNTADLSLSEMSLRQLEQTLAKSTSSTASGNGSVTKRQKQRHYNQEPQQHHYHQRVESEEPPAWQHDHSHLHRMDSSQGYPNDSLAGDSLVSINTADLSMSEMSLRQLEKTMQKASDNSSKCQESHGTNTSASASHPMDPESVVGSLPSASPHHRANQNHEGQHHDKQSTLKAGNRKYQQFFSASRDTNSSVEDTPPPPQLNQKSDAWQAGGLGFLSSTRKEQNHPHISFHRHSHSDDDDISAVTYSTKGTSKDRTKQITVSTENGMFDDLSPLQEGKEVKDNLPNDNFGRGIVRDFKETVLTHWKEEMTNLNLKTFSKCKCSCSCTTYHVSILIVPDSVLTSALLLFSGQHLSVLCVYYTRHYIWSNVSEGNAQLHWGSGDDHGHGFLRYLLPFAQWTAPYDQRWHRPNLGV